MRQNLSDPSSFRTFSPSSLFAAAVFCLVLAVSLGVKPIAAGHAFLALALLLALVERGKEALEFRGLPASAWALATFVAISIVSVIANADVIESPIEALGKLRYPLMAILLLAMPWVVRKPLSEPWRRDALAIAWLAPLALVVFVGLLNWRLGYSPIHGESPFSVTRISGIFGQVMTFAYSLQFSFILLASFFVHPGAWKAATRLPWWIAVVALLLCGGALYLTYTRGALLGAITGLATISLLRSWKLCAALVVIGMASAAVAKFDGARYFNMQSDIRLGQWRAAALSTLERPVFGLGYRNFEAHSARLKERYGFDKDIIRERGKPPREAYFQGHAHNIYLEAFASTGIFGGGAFLLFCWCWLRESLRSPYRLVFAPLVTTFLISGFFENTFFDSEVLNCILLIWLFCHWTLIWAAGAARPARPDVGGAEAAGA